MRRVEELSLRGSRGGHSRCRLATKASVIDSLQTTATSAGFGGHVDASKGMKGDSDGQVKLLYLERIGKREARDAAARNDDTEWSLVCVCHREVEVRLDASFLPLGDAAAVFVEMK